MTGTMRAVRLTGHGGLEQLDVRDDVPIPAPSTGDVLIEVGACGLNNTDVNTRVGWYAPSVTSETGAGETSEDGSWSGAIGFPRIQGADVAGRVVDVGDGVPRERIGERVLVDPWIRDPAGEDHRYLGSEIDGGYAEYVVVPGSNAHAVDTALDDIALASIPCSYSTAEHMLHRAGVAEGEWVLVSGASGGVGCALVQLAKRRGARVVALTVPSKADAVAELGADVVLDRRIDGLADAVRDATDGVHTYADVVGGPLFSSLYGTIRRGGHYVVSGAIAGPIVSLDLRTLYLRDLTMDGATVVPPEVFSSVVDAVVAGQVRPVVAATFPLERVVEAQQAFLRKEHVGAIVLEVAER